MHRHEIKTDTELVRRLVAHQFPRWRGLPVRALPFGGTDHALYRLGDDLVVRMPRIKWASGQPAGDLHWLTMLAPHLPLPVPTPVAVGEPGEGFPWPWSVVPWFDGENPGNGNFDAGRAAVDLAQFIAALQGIDTTGGRVKTGTARGVHLSALDEQTRAAITELGDRIDARQVTRAWEEALSAAAWAKPPVWIHGDLQAGNLLVQRQRLSAVIDWGGVGLGDPAPDLMAAWSVFDEVSRNDFRAALGCDDDTWQRGRGWALCTALIALPYYWDTFPRIVAESLYKVRQVCSGS